mmetsp:Transcript_691/g.2763  ORF Transcript_691/g.2763 Transcript_691/m.2763 type:complete len:214 (+) Transcript_691:3044-3685(+)
MASSTIGAVAARRGRAASAPDLAPRRQSLPLRRMAASAALLWASTRSSQGAVKSSAFAKRPCTPSGTGLVDVTTRDSCLQPSSLTTHDSGANAGWEESRPESRRKGLDSNSTLSSPSTRRVALGPAAAAAEASEAAPAAAAEPASLLSASTPSTSSVSLLSFAAGAAALAAAAVPPPPAALREAPGAAAAEPGAGSQRPTMHRKWVADWPDTS